MSRGSAEELVVLMLDPRMLTLLHELALPSHWVPDAPRCPKCSRLQCKPRGWWQLHPVTNKKAHPTADC